MIEGYPFNGVAYSAEDVADSFCDLVSNGVNIFGNSEALKVTKGSGMSVSVADGTGRIGGRVFRVEGQSLTLDPGSATERKDRVVVKMNAEAGQGGFTIYVKKGGSTPPELERNSTGTIYEISLATVTVQNSTVTVKDDRGDSSLCGYVSFLGNQPFYPSGSVPEDLWLYTIYPDELTPQQKAAIEGNPTLMTKWKGSVPYKLSQYTGAKSIVTKTFSSEHIAAGETRETRITLPECTNARIPQHEIEFNTADQKYTIYGKSVVVGELEAHETVGNMSATVTMDSAGILVSEHNLSSSSSLMPIYYGNIHVLVR